MEVHLLPNAPLGDDTELAFIDGRTFVNAAKHEQVVSVHAAEVDRLRAENERLRRVIEIALAWYKANAKTPFWTIQGRKVLARAPVATDEGLAP